MSLDLVVWLSCTVALSQDLPRQAEWRYSKISAENMPSLPKELVAQFDGLESWQVNRGQYLIRASHTDRAEKLQTVPAQDQRVPSAEEANSARIFKLGVNLVLEGSYDAGYPEQAAVAEHLARKCGGAIVESPTGYYKIDEHGKWKR